MDVQTGTPKVCTTGVASGVGGLGNSSGTRSGDKGKIPSDLLSRRVLVSLFVSELAVLG